MRNGRPSCPLAVRVQAQRFLNLNLSAQQRPLRRLLQRRIHPLHRIVIHPLAVGVLLSPLLDAYKSSKVIKMNAERETSSPRGVIDSRLMGYASVNVNIYMRERATFFGKTGGVGQASKPPGTVRL